MGYTSILNVLTTIRGQRRPNLFLDQEYGILVSIKIIRVEQPQDRCLGAALLYAAELFKVTNSLLNHIIVCTNGSLNYGPGKVILDDYEVYYWGPYDFVELPKQPCVLQVPHRHLCEPAHHYRSLYEPPGSSQL